MRIYAKFAEEAERADITVGDIHDISNKVWGIPVEKGFRHPGVVLSAARTYHKAVVAKGRDSNKILPKLKRLYYVVKPSAENKLDKDTAFYCVAEEASLAALQQDDFRGRLSDSDLQNLSDFCCF